MAKKDAKFHSTSNISSELAIEILTVAFSEAEKVGIDISVAVVDTSLSLKAFARGNEATPHSAETSRRKANTAASTKKATGWMNCELALTLPMASGNLLTNIPGGLPIRFGGVFGGAIGIAGGTVEQDSAIAKATLAAIGADADS